MAAGRRQRRAPRLLPRRPRERWRSIISLVCGGRRRTLLHNLLLSYYAPYLFSCEELCPSQFAGEDCCCKTAALRCCQLLWLTGRAPTVAGRDAAGG